MLNQNKYIKVKSLDYIISILDSNNSLNGLKFMPEMAQFCGKKFRIEKKVKRVIIDRIGLGVIPDTYILQDVYCDGTYHDNCTLKCSILWKKEWLELLKNPIDKIIDDSFFSLPKKIEEDGFCQTILLPKAAKSIPFSIFKKLLRYNYLSNSNISEIIRDIVYSINYILNPLKLVGTKRKTPDKKLGLKKGDVVMIKNITEILDTLDKNAKNRGLIFSPEMKKFCGKQYKVNEKVDKVMDEKTKNIREVNNSVILDDCRCDGSYHHYCDRSCYFIWREIWLEKKDEKK